jgi:hypothetical protein
VAVGERLEVGGSVTTTYYAWATRDRNTTVDDATLGVNAPLTDVTRYDERCQAAAEVDCVSMLAAVIVSEASVGNEEEQRAVAWTFRNRLDRGLSLLSYARDRAPNREGYFDLAREVLTAPPEADVTKGATHFFSPRSMPLQGQESRCSGNGGIYDCLLALVVRVAPRARHPQDPLFVLPHPPYSPARGPMTGAASLSTAASGPTTAWPQA